MQYVLWKTPGLWVKEYERANINANNCSWKSVQTKSWTQHSQHNHPSANVAKSCCRSEPREPSSDSPASHAQGFTTRALMTKALPDLQHYRNRAGINGLGAAFSITLRLLHECNVTPRAETRKWRTNNKLTHDALSCSGFHVTKHANWLCQFVL